MQTSTDTSPSQTLLILAAHYDGSADAQLLTHARHYDQTRVVAPASPPPGADWIVDDDDAVRQAHVRAGTIAATLRSHGLDTDTDVGDPDPLLAAADAIALHSVDALLILTCDDRSARRLERGSGRLARPVTMVTLHKAPPAHVPQGLAAAH
jgi:hypothetical protein